MHYRATILSPITATPAAPILPTLILTASSVPIRHFYNMLRKNIRVMLETMPAEPNWSKSISGTTVCWWFWFIGFLNAFAAVLAVLSVFITLYKGRAVLGMIAPLALVGLGFVNAWALFLVCKRGLNV